MKRCKHCKKWFTHPVDTVVFCSFDCYLDEACHGCKKSNTCGRDICTEKADK